MDTSNSNEEELQELSRAGLAGTVVQMKRFEIASQFRQWSSRRIMGRAMNAEDVQLKRRYGLLSEPSSVLLSPITFFTAMVNDDKKCKAMAECGAATLASAELTIKRLGPRLGLR